MLPVLVGGGFASWALWRAAELSLPVASLPVVGASLLLILSVGVTPGLRWRRWRYEIRAEEVDLQRGIFWIRRTLVPLARIQHVDTQRGPLQRRFGLATVVFYTAAGANQIPELAAPVADGVRDRIAELARTRDEL
jgi:membrane protein YdbS with pleckstrin-like domain